jgi:translocation and assembly module TamB
MNWKRILGWTLGSILLLIVIVFVGGYFLLNSSRFHEYVIGKVEQTASEATGGRVELQGYDFHLSTLTVNLYGILIRGTEGPEAAPLVAADKLTAKLKILSVLHHDVNLRELLLEHPVVHLVVDKEGRTNVPSPNAPKEKSSQTNVFDLAVGHVLLSNGVIIYNDQKNVLDANVYDLRTEVNFHSMQTSYSGSVVYNRGELKYGDLRPMAHNLDLEFSAAPSQLSIQKLQLAVGSSRVSLTGNVTNYNNPVVDGHYNVLIHTQDLNGLVKTASTNGDIAMGGTLQYQSREGQPALRSVVSNGQISSGELNLASVEGRVVVRSLRGNYRLADGNLTAPDIAMNLLDGEIRAKLNLDHIDQNPSGKLQASIKGLSIQAAKLASRNPSLHDLPLTGTVSGDADASWNPGMKGLMAKSDIAITGALHNNASTANPVPLNGALHVIYDGARNLISIRDTKLHTPSTSIVAQGTVGNRSNLTVQANLSDLRELASLASALLPPPNAGAAKPLDLAGSATANAVITGTLQKPSVSAQVNAQNLQMEGTQWKSLHVAADANPSQVTFKDGSLVAAGQGQIRFSGNIGLHNWAYAATNPLAVSLSAHQIAIADLQHMARVHYPVRGIVSLDANLHGTQEEPVGQGTLRVSKAEAYDQPIQTLAADFQAANGKVTSTLQVKISAGAATGRLEFTPKTNAYQLQFDAPRVLLQELQAVQARNIPVQGVLAAAASGSGTLSNPQLTANIQIPELQLQHTKATGISARLNVANHRADATVSTDVANATIRGKGSVDLTGDYNAVASFDTSSLPLTPLLSTYVTTLPSDLDSQLEMHASLKGPLKDKSRLEAHVVIPTLSAKYQQLQLANSGPMRFDYANSVLTIQPSQLTGTDTSLRIQGRVPVQNGAPIDLTAQGSVNLRLLRLFSPDLQSSGTLALDVRGTGDAAHPGVDGQIKVQKASFITSDSPVGLENLNGVLTLAKGRIQLTDLKGQAGGGNISIGGSIGYQPVQFDVAINAKSVRLLYPGGIRSVFDGNIAMTGTPESSALNGRVLIDSLSFTPDFDLANFMSQSGGGSVSTSTNSFTNNMKLNIAVQSTENLQAVSSEVSVEGSANLRVIGTAADPVIVGRADLNSGDIFFMKNRYQLQRGILNFVNPTRTEPTVNILITTVIQQYNLSLGLLGPVDKLRTTYTSDPPLPPVDIINLIARGETTENSTASNFDANQVLAAGLASQVSSRIGKLAGLSSLTIDPTLGGSNGNPSARVAIQQRVTRKFLFTFSTDVTQPQAEVVQGEYQISKRWSVTATRDQYGGYAFDGRFHTTF